MLYFDWSECLENLFSNLSYLSFILLLFGYFKPTSIIFWGKEEDKTSIKVLKTYGSLSLFTSIFYLKLIRRFLSTIFTLVIIFFILGMINPKSIIRFGNDELKNRKTILIYLGIPLLFQLFIFLLMTPILS